MRSCAYCGKDLADGEKCNCRISNSKRNASDTSSDSTKQNKTTGTEYSDWQENSYRTGYTKKERKSFKDIFKRKKKSSFRASDFKSATNDVSGFTKRFIRNPAETVSNPGSLNALQMIIILLITSVSLSVSSFMITAKMLTLPGTGEFVYKIGNLLRWTLSGTISTGVILAIYFGILYLINKYIMRSYTVFKDFIIRPVAALVPFMVFSALGMVISIFTVFATVMLLMTGVIMWIILTYEALRSEWSFASPNKVIYCIAVAFFVLFTIVYNLLRYI